MKQLLYACLCILLYLNVYSIHAQSFSFPQQNQWQPIDGPKSEKSCSTDEYEQYLQTHDPEYVKNKAAYEKTYLQEMAKPRENSAAKSNVVIKVPIVIHIVQNCAFYGSTANPADESVEEILNIANQRFQHTHVGAKTYSNPLYGVDTEIELCLATKAPDGSYTTGIIRHQTDQYHINDYFQMGPYFVDNYVWDRDKYLNLFVVTDLTNASGVYMGGLDIVIIDASSFWSGLMVHEIGHYFSLAHTFSSNGTCSVNTSCLTQGDRVCDTPVKDVPGLNGAAGCDNPINSCDTDDNDVTLDNPYRPVSMGGEGDQPDMLANYLDYTGSCWDALTQGQKDRMRINLNTVRSNMISSSNLNATCPPTTPPDEEVELIGFIPNQAPCSATFYPVVGVRNKGAVTLTTLDIEVTDGVAATITASWSGTLSPDSIMALLLPATDFAIGDLSLDVNLFDPNGNTTEEFTNNNHQCVSYSNFGEGAELPINEDLASCGANSQLRVSNGANVAWTVQDYSQVGCQDCVLQLLGFAPSTEVATVILPVMDFQGHGQPVLNFTYGHLPRYDFITNTLRVLANSECGTTTVIWEASGWEELATNDPPATTGGTFAYPACDQFKLIQVDLSAYMDEPYTSVGIQAEGRWYSPLILDDILVEDLAPLPVELLSFTAVKQDRQAILRWETTSEVDNSHFVLEQSSDSRHFTPITEIASAGHAGVVQSYRHVDRHPLNGVNYYRLVQVNEDGSEEILGIRTLRFDFEQTFRVMPNPAKGSELFISLPASDLSATLTLYDATGRQVRQLEVQPGILQQTLPIGLLSNGIYLLQWTTGTVQETKRVVIQR